MAELTTLESKLGEVVGLAMAAQEATQKVMKLPELEEDLAQKLERMHKEAAAAERRGTELAGPYEGKKTAILEEARETKSKAKEMLTTYLDEQSDALDGFRSSSGTSRTCNWLPRSSHPKKTHRRWSDAFHLVHPRRRPRRSARTVLPSRP